jgi:hypothetical protein
MARIRKAAVLVGCFVVALYVLNYIFTPMLLGEREIEIYFRPHCRLMFDSKTWKRGGLKVSGGIAENYGKRYEMLDDLLSSHALVGMKEDSLVMQLGQSKRLFYILGDQRNYPAKSVLFPGAFANFDRWKMEIVISDGKVTSYKILFA